ncbi:MAG: Rid family hydrolase, partial [Balneolales bacterium]
MKSKNIVQTSNAPEAIGPYSQAVINDNIVYCSGQIAMDPKNGKLIEGGIEDQIKQVMNNLEA